MSFDFRQLDEVIELLQKKTLSPGSPPVMEDGTLGIWRTVRGFRVFLELVPGAGKYNFDGKSYKGGRVMVGPPSLTGKDIGNVDNDTWGGLSGSGTKANFTTASEQGISALKSSIRNSLKSDDTRRAALDETSDLQKLVQIARSAGFTDSEIKESLGGKTFQNALDHKGDPVPDNVVPFKPKAKKPETPDPESKDEAPAAPKANKPVPPGPSPDEKPQLAAASGGEDINTVLAALKVPGIINADKKRKIAEDLEEAASKVKNEFFRKQLEGYAHGLKTGDFKVEEVRQSVTALLEHRKKVLISKLSEADIDKLHDKALAKDTVAELKVHAAESSTKPFNSEVEAADRYFYEQKLEKLEAALRDPKVKEQVRVLREQVKAKRLGGNSLILRLLQILRFILAFLPG